MSDQESLKGQFSLQKEAGVADSVLNAARKINPNNLLKGLRNTRTPAGEGATQKGAFVSRPGDATVNKKDLNLFGREEIIDQAQNDMKREGTGSFVADGLLGLTKRIVPKTKEPIENAVVKGKGVLESVNTKAGAKLAGSNPDSMRGKFFSGKTQNIVGEVKNADGSVSKVMREDRKPSAVAPVENAIKFTTPFLGAAYVADKMYPTEESTNGTGDTYEQYVSKQASEQELFDDEAVGNMDKLASLQKIASLEEKIEKYASEVNQLSMEKLATEKVLEKTIEEKRSMEKRASEAESHLMEKNAEFEELRLRTIAQKRSKVAVDLADELLGTGLIKQAGYNVMVDELMDCDERTINTYQNMVKQAKKQEESLETLSILGEYKINDKPAPSPHELGVQGLSKRGQSIGEAARDLNHK